MKTPEQRGAFGAWLVDQRARLSAVRGKKMRQQDVVDEIRTSVPYPMDPAYYRALEGGSKKPGRETREALARYFGSTPPSDQPSQGPELGELVSAVRDQTAAITALVEVLQTQQDQQWSQIAEAIGESLSLHLAPQIVEAVRLVIREEQQQ